MAIRYEIFPGKQLIRIRVEGTLTPGALRDHLDALHADPQFSSAYRRLVDVRAVDALPSTHDIHELVAEVARDGRDHVPRAVVADSPCMYGMFRMFEILSDLCGHQNRVFRTMEEAEQWLERPEGEHGLLWAGW